MAQVSFTPQGTAVTASGNSSAIDTTIQFQGCPQAAQYIGVQVNVTAVSGTTPSLTVELQWSNDGVNFASVQGSADIFTAVTAAGNVNKQFIVKGRYAQLKYTVSGTTPSFTLGSFAYLS